MGPFFREESPDHLFRLTGQSLFLGQQIEGEGEGKHQVDHQREDGGGDADGGVEKILSILGEKGGDVVLQLCGIEREFRQLDGVGLQEAHQIVPPVLQVNQPAGEQADKVYHAVLQGRDHNEENGEDNPHQQQGAHQQAHRPLGLFLPGAVPLSPGAPPTPFHGAENDIEQKGQTAAQQKGQEDGKDRGKHPSGLPRVVEPPIEQQPEGDEQGYPLHVFLV